MFRPNGAARLVVSNSLFANNGSGVTGAGIRVIPSSGGTAQVSITRSDFPGNIFGFALDGTGGGNGINAIISDSTLAANKQDGIVAVGGLVGVTVDLVNSAQNGGNGIRSIGANATIRVSRSNITGNGTGLAVLSGGQLLTSGSSYVEANGSNGSFTGTFVAK